MTQPSPAPQARRRIVPFSVRMRSRASIEAETIGAYGGMGIRLEAVTKDVVTMLGLPDGTTWVWAIIQARPGQPDAVLFGGSSDSVTGAEAQAREQFKKYEHEQAQQRAGKLVRP